MLKGKRRNENKEEPFSWSTFNKKVFKRSPTGNKKDGIHTNENRKGGVMEKRTTRRSPE